MRDDARCEATGAFEEAHIGSIAIVGMAGRFPDAADIVAFWRNLETGRECIRDLAESELDDDFTPEERRAPSYVKRRPILDGIENFDAAFFGMTAREAQLTDPQQRVFLECAWAALEDAGIDPGASTGPIGIFAGSALNTYFLRHVAGSRDKIRAFTTTFQVGQYQELLGAMQDFVASRVAYKLDLKGPAVTVQSACSTSLLAVAQACQSLQLFQCDAALAGGVSISVPQRRGYESLDGGMVSEDGHVRPFDADANGTVFGSGAGVVVLKRLEDALAHGEHIYAVIRGFGVNNDGGNKVGFTAPSVGGQTDVIRQAHANAGVTADDIDFVEAHGTATPLGDPIEFKALQNAFGSTVRASPCLLGSVKANIGHLDAAAGIAGLIKAALQLHHQRIVPQINFSAANPEIDLMRGPFRVEPQGRLWPRGVRRRMAGVSAFGVGGTNVHVVIEEAPAQLNRATRDSVVLLPLSAKTPEALRLSAERMAEALAASDAPRLDDVAETLAFGRRAFAVRSSLVAGTIGDAVTQLRRIASRTDAAGAAGSGDAAFLFPGQGSQYPGMAARLYRSEPVFAQWIDRGADIAAPLIGADIRTQIFDAAPGDETLPHALRDTTLAQPALYIVEYALAQLWLGRGVRPAMLVGHSLGEFVAAALAGVFSHADGLKLVCARGRVMQVLPAGGMMAVRGAREAVEKLLQSGVEIAAINAPSLVTVAGAREALDHFAARAEAAGLVTRSLHTSHAFHTSAMEPAIADLEPLATSIALNAPTIPIASCVTGTWMTANEATSPAYWARHCRVPVLFADALATVLARGPACLLEVGPGRTLTTFAQQSGVRERGARAIASLPEFAERDGDVATDLAAVGHLWEAGAGLTLPHTPGGRRVSLPTYPFAKARHWIEIDTAVEVSPPAARPSPPQGQAATLPMPSNAETQSSSPNSESQMSRHHSQLIQKILAILEDLSAETIGPDAMDRTFLELGFDSLMLGQVAQRLQKSLGVKITFRQLLGDLPTIEALAAHLAQIVPPSPGPTAEVVSVAAAAVAVPAEIPNGSLTVTDGGLESLIRDQLAMVERVIGRQLDAVRAQGGDVRGPLAEAPIVTRPAVVKAAAADDIVGGERFRMFETRARSRDSGTFSEAQRALIADLVRRSDAKMPNSKADTQTHRRVQADPRSASGFRAEWKDLVYPLVVDRSQGAKLWDVDGNEYVDLVNGFGQTMFGHAPAFVTDAISRQMAKGFAIGPQTPLAGKVAARLAKCLGHERVAFCNTGSEAVMAAMRVARAVTGRSKIVFFGGDYHGQFDEVLAKGLSRRAAVPGAQPAASGVTPEAVANMVVLPYDAPESLAYIREHGAELAAVLVEPVQSRHPGLVPRAFLSELRVITERAGIALILDEVVTGFRAHPAGVQGLLGLKADIATYGKVLGGGMPLGILAGSSRFMDALDGGYWTFDDASVPEVAPTFFAGTFVRHPLTLAAADAVLDHLEQGGARLQEMLSRTTAALVERMNGSLARRGIKSRIEVFASLFYFHLATEDPLASLLYPLMRLEGVHIAEGFPCFLTTAHGAADIAHIVAAFERALDALQGAGILSLGAAVADRRAGEMQPMRSASKAASISTFPLTEAQQEVYLAAQLGDAASCAFNESVSISIDGTVDNVALEESLCDLVKRHDALRGRFGVTGETMCISDNVTVGVTRHDFSQSAASAQALEALNSAEARSPFDLQHGPLLRARLATLAADKHVLVLTAHHIICDGWSLNTLVGELVEIYRARVSGTTPHLADVMPFSVYALDAGGSASAATNARQFWADIYRTPPAALELPSDRPRPAERTWAGASVSEKIDGTLATALKKVAASQKTTLFSVLFSALQIVIGRLADTEDVVLVVPMAAQANLDERSLVGHCVNFLPVRQTFSMDAPFSKHLANVHRMMLGVLAHQDYTLGTLVRELTIARTIGRTPLSDVQFNLERLADDMVVPGARISVAPNAKAAVNFDLFFNVIDRRDGLQVDVDYNTDLYDAATVRRWIGHFRSVLRAVVDAPDAVIGRIDLLDDGQRRWLLDDLNATASPFDRSATVHGLISAQARRTPDKMAVWCNGNVVTYRELDRASDVLADLIRRRVAGRGGRIAVAVDRSIDLLCTLVAVMKAGHAYVPLDPTHPPQRLKATIEAARVSALIANDAVSVAWVGSDIGVIALDETELAGAAATDAVGVASGSSADEPAYVIFTSGSTGVPKGVEVGQRAVVNFLQSMARTPGFQSSDHLLAVTTVCFDIAGLELFLPLIAGGSLTIATREQVRDGFALVDLIGTSGATVMQATPSLWQMLLEAGLIPRSGLKMLCGGEPMPRDLADTLTATGGELWNMYGPTETTIWSSTGRVGKGPITIGAPIANTQFVVLDSRDQMQPVGVSGDLYIGGDGLANGYFDRPDLTAAAFRNIAIAPQRMQRLYRTGDVALRAPDGTLHLHGRRDQQIKLRGYRIELEEIESVLRRSPQVAAAAVALRDDGKAGPRLVAFIVPATGVQAQPTAIGNFAGASLPDYMVPAALVIVETLPLTGNGKLDRKALKSLPLTDTAAKTDGTADRMPPHDTKVVELSPMEATIAAVWCEVLGLAQVGPHVSIYDLGADSLHIFRIAARLNARGVPLPAKDILRLATVARQAECAESNAATSVRSTGKADAPAGRLPLLSDYRAGAMRNRRTAQ